MFAVVVVVERGKRTHLGGGLVGLELTEVGLLDEVTAGYGRGGEAAGGSGGGASLERRRRG